MYRYAFTIVILISIVGAEGGHQNPTNDNGAPTLHHYNSY